MKVFLIACTVIFLGFPLLGGAFIPTHDGEYHLIRFMEFYSMLAQGYYFPRWAPTMNSGFGIPIFLFHYPFPNYVGSLFHAAGFQFVDAFKLALFFGYFVSSLFCYAFLSKLWGKTSAFFGTVAALSVPYWFVDIYVRGSVGEVWAIAWMFACGAAIVWEKPLLLSVSAALLILSHNIQALLFFPVIIVFVLYRNKKYFLSIVLGVVLSAYFWLPALVERSFVVGLSTVNPLDHFAGVWELFIPTWGTEFSGRAIQANKMSFQIGIIPLIWIILAGWRSIAMAAIVIFFMLPVSQVIWTTIPGMSYIQYPWRLLSYFIPIVAISAARVASKISMKKAIVISSLGIILIYGYSRPVTYERRNDLYYSTKPNFTHGTSSMGNAFSTIWTPWKEQSAQNLIEATPSATIIFTEQKPLSTGITLETREETKVKMNRLYFPGWKVYDNQKEIDVDQTDGLINFSLGAGSHNVRVAFEATPVRMAANIVSGIGLLWLLGWAILRYIYAYRHKYNSNDRWQQRAGHRPVYKRARPGAKRV